MKNIPWRIDRNRRFVLLGESPFTDTCATQMDTYLFEDLIKRIEDQGRTPKYCPDRAMIRIVYSDFLLHKNVFVFNKTIEKLMFALLDCCPDAWGKYPFSETQLMCGYGHEYDNAMWLDVRIPNDNHEIRVTRIKQVACALSAPFKMFNYWMRFEVALSRTGEWSRRFARDTTVRPAPVATVSTQCVMDKKHR